MSTGWYGVDFDGTLAHYDKWRGAAHTGAPIPKMVERVKKWLAEGKNVRILTARVYCPPITETNITEEEYTFRSREARTSKLAIEGWCQEHLGKVLPVTCTKDFSMVELWDDRSVQLIPNTGIRAEAVSVIPVEDGSSNVTVLPSEMIGDPEVYKPEVMEFMQARQART